MKIIIPKHLEGRDKLKFIVENKSLLIAQKKSAIKCADATMFRKTFVSEKGEAVKAAAPTKAENGTIKINPVINTTNYYDSHGDVHLPGIWKETLKRNPKLYLVQEHKSSQFDKIISSDFTAITKKMSWKDLGAPYEGVTECLIFSDCNITPDRNPYMYAQYEKGFVDNHSVGMRYIDILLAVDDSDYKQEFANWNQYIDEVANKEDAQADGYMWLVKEAGIAEGSAVPMGSNDITPTLDENFEIYGDATGKQQPSTDTLPKSEMSFMDYINKTTFVKI